MGLSGTARHRVSILAEKYDGIYKLEDHGGFHREAPKATHTLTLGFGTTLQLITFRRTFKKRGLPASPRGGPSPTCTCRIPCCRGRSCSCRRKWRHSKRRFLYKANTRIPGKTMFFSYDSIIMRKFSPGTALVDEAATRIMEAGLVQ